MGVTEEEVGIRCFRSSHLGFRAVVKQRYQDFVVNEICPSGEIIQITNDNIVEGIDYYLEKRGKRKRGDGGDGKRGVVSKEELEKGFEELEKEFVDDEEFLERLRKFVEDLNGVDDEQRSGEDRKGRKDRRGEMFLYSMQDKQKRTIAHKWCSRYLPNVISDTITKGDVGEGSGCKEGNGAERQQRLIRIRPRKDLRPWKRVERSRKRPRTSEGDHTNFRVGDKLNDNTSVEKVNGGTEHEAVAVDARRSDTYDPRQDRDEKAGDWVPRSTYVSFVLRKENTDTSDAVATISRILKHGKSAVSHAGTKDKRALTFQEMRVRGAPLAKLRGINKILKRGRANMMIGNIKLCSGNDNRALKLGDLKGNQFTICLRNLSFHEATLEGTTKKVDHPSHDNHFEKLERVVVSAGEFVQNRGFINYFGLQRFGSGASPTHETGYSVLSRDFQKAISSILQPSILSHRTEQQTESRQRQTLSQFQQKKITASQALQSLPKFMNIERKILESFARDEKHHQGKYDYQAAFSALPLNLRKMYVHAVQSYLWNIMASARISESSTMFAKAGDMICCEGDSLESDKSEKLLASTKVRAVTVEEERDEKVGIDRVLLPLLGKGIDGSGFVGKWAEVCREEVRERKLNFENALPELGIMGGWRRLIARPLDLSVQVVEYQNWNDDLIQIAEKGIERESEKNRKDCCDRKVGGVLRFSLGTAEYATMCIRELTKMNSSVEAQIKAQAASNNVNGIDCAVRKKEGQKMVECTR